MTNRDREEADRRWVELNRAILKFAKEGDFGGLEGTYSQMAFQMWQEGKDFFGLLEQRNRYGLLYFQSIGFDYVRIIVAKGDDPAYVCCSSCEKNSDRIYSIENALKEMPIPCKECTHDLQESGAKTGWCRCAYVVASEPEK